MAEEKAVEGVNLCHTSIMEKRDRDANLVVVAACSGKGKTRMLPRPLISRDIPKLPTSVQSVCSRIFRTGQGGHNHQFDSPLCTAVAVPMVTMQAHRSRETVL